MLTVINTSTQHAIASFELIVVELVVDFTQRDSCMMVLRNRSLNHH